MTGRTVVCDVEREAVVGVVSGVKFVEGVVGEFWRLDVVTDRGSV